MAYCERLALWFTGSCTLCVIWSVAADDQIQVLVTAGLPGDWPGDTPSINTASKSTNTLVHTGGFRQIPSTHGDVGMGASSHTVLENLYTSIAATTTAVSAIVKPTIQVMPWTSGAKANSTSLVSTTQTVLVSNSTPPMTSTSKPFTHPTPSPFPKTRVQPSYVPPTTLPGVPSQTQTHLSPTIADVDGDYEKKLEDRVEKTSGPGTEEDPPLCDFDPCVHLQRPCLELREAKEQRCSCPGLTPPTLTPGPVVALDIMKVWPETASVRWCAPYSSVSSFSVWVMRQDGSVLSNGSVSSWARQADVFGLEHRQMYRVCVSVQYGMKTSPTRCVLIFTPQNSDVIALYLLAGSSAVFLLMLVVLGVCLYKQCKKGSVPNQVVQTLHSPKPTSYVSIPNPTYTQDDDQSGPVHTQNC